MRLPSVDPRPTRGPGHCARRHRRPAVRVGTGIRRRPRLPGRGAWRRSNGRSRSPARQWASTPETNQVVVTVDSSVKGARLASGQGLGPQPRRGGAPRVRRPARSARLRHRRRRDLRRRVPLLARLQRPQRQHVLLPDRRPLQQDRAQRGGRQQLAARCIGGTGRHQLPRQRLRHRPLQHARMRPTRPGTRRAAQDITSAGERRRRPVGHPPRQHHRASTAARSPRSTRP